MTAYEPGDQILYTDIQGAPNLNLVWGVVIREATTAENSAIATLGAAGPGPFLWIAQSSAGGVSAQVSSGTFPFYSGVLYAGEPDVIAVYKPHSVDKTAVSGYLA